MKKKIEEFLQKKKEKHIQFYMVYRVILVKIRSDREEERMETYLRSSNRRLIHMDEFDEVYREQMEKINQKLDAHIH